MQDDGAIKAMSDEQLAEVRAECAKRGGRYPGPNPFTVPALLATIDDLRQVVEWYSSVTEEETFRVLWEHYGSADPATLAPDAQALRSRLRAIVGADVVQTMDLQVFNGPMWDALRDRMDEASEEARRASGAGYEEDRVARDFVRDE